MFRQPVVEADSSALNMQRINRLLPSVTDQSDGFASLPGGSRPGTKAASVITLMLLFGGAIALAWRAGNSYNSLPFVLPMAGNVTVLEPEQWIGRRFPIARRGRP